MTTAVAASRNKILKINGRNGTISSRDRIPEDPKISPQYSFRYLDDTLSPSSSDDDPSDMSADESSQGPTESTTAPPPKGRIADKFDVGDEFSKGPPRSSSWADLDISIIVAVIAPLVNWLTGSDQIKNLFLVLFLIVYLHQLVQGVSQYPLLVLAGSLISSKFPGNCTMLHENGNPTLRFAH
jgi:hypothetical protein